MIGSEAASVTGGDCPPVERFLNARLKQLREGWPQHLVLDCTDAQAEAGEVLAKLSLAAARVGFIYLSLDRLVERPHPLIQLADRFLGLAGTDLPNPRWEDTAETYLRFSKAVHAACKVQTAPILVSISDAEAIRKRPDGVSVLSAIRSALNEAQQQIVSIFMLPSYLTVCLFAAGKSDPFYDFGTALQLRNELASRSAG